MSFTDDGDNDETLTSAATAAVAPAPGGEEDTEDGAEEHAPLWSATMTVEWVFQGYGYYSTPTKQAGSLAPDSFEADGAAYTVTMIEANGWLMYIGLDKELPFDFALELDGAQFASGDASFNAYSYGNIYSWTGTGLSWSDGDAVEVRLLHAVEKEEAANIPATGAPAVTGTAQVGETLTADTSGIADEDGLEDAAFTYQWTAGDADIPGATNSTYTLAEADAGKAVGVRVSFTDDGGNEESLTSEATDAVAGTPPAQPTGLSADLSVKQVTLTWDDPQDDSITGYVILRRIRGYDADGVFATHVEDTGSAATTYTDDATEWETPYTYRIKAVNEHGTSERSRWVHVETPRPPALEGRKPLHSAGQRQVQQRQDPPANQVWSGTVTVAAIGTLAYGFEGSTGSLDNTGFTVATRDYTIDGIYVGKQGVSATEDKLYFSLSSAATLAEEEALVLNAGGNEYPLVDDDDEVASTYTFIWEDTGLDWESETSVTLRLTLQSVSEVSLQNDLAATTATIGRVLVDESARGTIGPTSGDVDWFAVNLEKDTAYRIDQEGSPTNKGTLSDPILGPIYDDSANTVSIGNDDSGVGNNARIRFTPTATGTYYLSAGGNGATGTYRVSVKGPRSGDATLSALSVLDGATELVSGFAADTTTYTASVANSVTTVTVSATENDSGAEAVITPEDSDTNTMGHQVSLDVGETTITVTVTAEDDSTEDYTVTVTRADTDLAADTTTGRVAVGESATGTISPKDDIDWFKVELEADTTYIIDVEGSETSKGTLGDPKLNGIHDADGNDIAGTSDDDGGEGNNAQKSFTPTASGAYFIEVKHATGGDTGTYTVSVTRVDTGDATLSALSVLDGTTELVSGFAADTTTYTATVDQQRDDGDGIRRPSGDIRRRGRHHHRRTR